MSDEKSCSCESGTCESCDPCPDEIDPESEGWLQCPEPPAEAFMVNSVVLPPGYQLSQFVDVKGDVPVVNETLYAAVIKIFPKRFFFMDGTGKRVTYTREEWIEKNGADPLAQLAWQRKNQGVKVNGAKIGKERFKPKF